MDLCSAMGPGEGMLVGSFARALFLVHSESLESAYISSRPFRVNAGAVRTPTCNPQPWCLVGACEPGRRSKQGAKQPWGSAA